MRQTFPRLAAVLSVFLLILAAMPYQAAAKDSGKKLSILRITPDGDNVSAARQIVIEFNRPVAALGQKAGSQDDLGISITPEAACQWQWLNRSTLACQLDKDAALQPATQYQIDIAPKIAAEDGATLGENVSHRFTTARPRVESAYVVRWESPVRPILQIYLNQPVTKDSLLRHVFMTAQSGGQRYDIEASAVPDDTREVLRKGSQEARRAWMINPTADLPEDAAIILREEAGLVSALGDATGQTAQNVKTFYTFPPFALRAIICRDADNNEVRVTPDQPQNADRLCNPLQPVRLAFSAPVLRSSVKEFLGVSPSLSGGKSSYDPWGKENRDWSRLHDDRSDANSEYAIGLPVGLKAAQDYIFDVGIAKPGLWARIKAIFTGSLPQETRLKDEFGRSIAPFSIKLSTGHRNPNFELVYRDAVLEKSIESDVPLYVNNLQDYSFQYTRLTKAGTQAGSTGDVQVPFVQDVQYAVPLNVREILGGKSGAVFGFIGTNPQAKDKWDGAGRLFAQVTPFQVYAKIGHFGSKVWVTDLATGKPVEGARVRVQRGTLTGLNLSDAPAQQVETDRDGLADLGGAKDIDPDLALQNSYDDKDERLFVRVDKGEDMALLPLSYDYEVQMWNVSDDIYAVSEKRYGHMKAWGMTAQGIYRAGDTIDYKIYVRDQDLKRLITPEKSAYKLGITDPAGKSVDVKTDLALSDFGTLSGKFTLPKTAAVGWYSFKLETEFNIDGNDGKPEKREFYPLSVLVSDFTPAPFRVSTEVNGVSFKPGDTLDITTQAALHSGGGYGDAAVRTTVLLRPRTFAPQTQSARGFTFSSLTEEDRIELMQESGTLDSRGLLQTKLTISEQPIVFGDLRIESAVRDDRGKSIASEARVSYTGVDRLVGLKPNSWVFTAGQEAGLKTIVVDPSGAAIKNVKINIDIEREDVATAKVKSAGNAYLNDNTVEWKKVADCQLKSAEGAKSCAFTPEEAGSYRAVAHITDTKGRAHTTTEYLWVAGGDYVRWNEGREYALTLIPEKDDYKVGETARYLLKNPYPGATALITVERLGVLDHFVKVMNDSAAIIEIPVKAEHLPGAYVSVVLVSPRVETPPPEMGQIDMGKPTFRAGYARLPVSEPYKQLTVTPKAAQDVYRPGETVSVDIDVKTDEEVELAVAVLDESVFDLIAAGRDAYDPYKGFYTQDMLDMSNYSLMTRLIGRQKFEKKGANAGGDGGDEGNLRNIFKFVSHWNPSVPVTNGRATIDFTAPDNLTGWRILAMAVTKNDKMGLGDSAFKVNRPTEIRPVMPNQVREGDAFSAGFSVMNRTDQTRTIDVRIAAKGSMAKDEVHEQQVTLEPYKRVSVFMPVKAGILPSDNGEIIFEASAGDNTDRDRVAHALPVTRTRVIETSAIYGSITDGAVENTVQVPDDIFAGSAKMNVRFSSTLLNNLDGAFDYMRDYPHTCWEQQLSRAAMAASYMTLKPALATEWKDAETLTQSILDQAADYQAPNGGMAYFSPQDRYADPYLSAYTALMFTALKARSYDIPQGVEEKLHAYLLNMLRKNAAPSYYSAGMVADVRAVALAALRDSGKITPDDISRLNPDETGMGLFGRAHLLQASSGFESAKVQSDRLLRNLMSSAVETSGKISFNETYNEESKRTLSSPLRDQCVILDVLVSYRDADGVSPLTEKLARTITQARGVKTHWENTQENMFCMKALSHYASVFESNDPDMTVVALWGGDKIGAGRLTGKTSQPVAISHDIADSTSGKTENLTLSKDGEGRAYYTAQLQYAPRHPVEDVNAGFDISRRYQIFKDGAWQPLADNARLTRGDIVKVDLSVSLPAARHFVAVFDPLPGGLETINRDLATASSVDTQASEETSQWHFYHRELRHDSARFYADWLPAGDYEITYTAQAIATGTFAAPPARVEEMYDPDIYGRGIAKEFVIDEAR